MTKRIIAFALLIVMVGSLLLACDSSKSGPITDEEAIAIALKDMGISEKDADAVHIHVGTHEGQPCFNVYITYGSTNKTYVIHPISGDILEILDGAGHSH